MKVEGHMDIRPLTLRGTFGIAWAIVRRNFGAAYLYALVMQLLLALGALVAFSPVLVGLFKSSYGAEDLEIALNILIGVLLLLAYNAAWALVYAPVFSGTLYGEFSARIYGPGAPAGKLLRRGRHSLKRFFVTNLCLIAALLAVNFAVSLLGGILGGVLGFAGVAAALFTPLAGGRWEALEGLLTGMSAGLIAYFALAALLNWALALCGQSLIAFVYPVAVNENARNFDAVGRSLKLAWKRLGRVLGVKALFSIAYTLVLLALVGGAVATLIGQEAAPGVTLSPASLWITCALALAAFLIGLLGGLYSIALDTVLYYDARVRLEGRAWLGMDAQADPGEPRAEHMNPVSQDDPNDENNSGGGYGT